MMGVLPLMMPLIVIEALMIHGQEIVMVKEELEYRQSNMLVCF